MNSKILVGTTLALSLIFQGPFVSSSWGGTNTDNETAQVRPFLIGMIKASSPDHDHKEQIPNNLREVLAEHPELLLRILENRDVPELFAEADIPMPTEDLQKVTAALSPEMAAADKLRNEIGKELVSALAREYVKGSKEDRFEKLKAIPDDSFLELADAINNGIAEIKFSETPAVKMLRDPETGIDLNGLPQKFAEFIDIIMSQYFDKISLEDKREIIIGQLKLPKTASNIDKLSSFLQNSGPAVQKFFQLFGKSVKSPLMADAMAKLKSNITPFEFALVRETIEKNYGKKLEDLFSSFDEKPLAAATIGQVHKAKIKGTGEKVVVKIQRPKIREKALRELAMMESLAPEEGTKQIVRRLQEALLEETDFTIEAQNLEDAKAYRKKFFGLHAVKVAKGFPPSKEVLVMEMASGSNPEKFTSKEDLEKKFSALTHLLEVWFKEALFGSGFFHADLHTGNMFFEKKGIVPGYQLTLIDFGSVGRLSFKEKKGIINLGLGVVFLSPETVLQSFSMFDDLSPEIQAKFGEKITQILARNDKEIGWKTSEVLTTAIELGVNFPKNLLQFNRGKSFIDSQIKEILADLEKLGVKKKVKSPFGDEISVNDNIASKVLIHGLTPDLIKFFLKVGKSKGYLDKKTVKKVLREKIKPLLIDRVKNMFKKPKDKHCEDKKELEGPLPNLTDTLLPALPQAN